MTVDLFNILREIIKLHKDVFLTAYIFFVNGITFLFHYVTRLSSSRWTIYLTVKPTLYLSFQRTLHVLHQSWFSNYNPACGCQVSTTQRIDTWNSKRTASQPINFQWKWSRYLEMNPSGRGKYPLYTTQIIFQKVPLTISDPFLVSTNKNTESITCKRGDIWHDNPHNNHARQESSLQEEYRPTDWTVFPSTKLWKSLKQQHNI